MTKKKEKNEAWSRQENFVREIERDTKEKSEQVAQKLAQAVRTQEEKQAKRQAARAGARGRSSQAYTQADTWNAKENSPVRTKISALGETAGGTRPDTDAWGGTTHTGAYEWEKAPGLHTMELRIPGAGLTGTQPGGMMKEISRRVAAAVQPGSLELQPSPIGPLQKPENLPFDMSKENEIQLLSAQHIGDSAGYTEEELRDEINRVLDEQYPNTANGFATEKRGFVPSISFIIGSLADKRMNEALNAIAENSDSIKQAAAEYGMPPELIASIILKEQYTQSIGDWAAILRSNWKESEGSTGLGAIRADTARAAWKNLDEAVYESLPEDNTELLRKLAYDDEFNINTIAAVLAMEAQRARNNGELSDAETMKDFTQEDWKQVLRAYNAGWTKDDENPGWYTGGYRYADYTAEYMPYLKYFLER